MRRDIYISARLLNNKCIYAATNVFAGQYKDEPLVGHLHLSRPNKACMYVTDMVELDRNYIDDTKVYHFETKEAREYVEQMRTIHISPAGNEEIWLENQKLIMRYIAENYPAYKELQYRDLER